MAELTEDYQSPGPRQQTSGDSDDAEQYEKEEDQNDSDQNLGSSERRSGNGIEPEQARNGGYHEKNEDPLDHNEISLGNFLALMKQEEICSESERCEARRTRPVAGNRKTGRA